MKLELKHLAGYLPYGLKFISRNDFGSQWLLIGIKIDEKFPLEPTLLSERKDYKNTINIWSRNAKPILHSLSDLTKEIEVNGEKFVPADIINNDFFWDYVSNNMRALVKDECYILVGYLPALVVDKLLEWHFDIYGLIDEGLAIDINTLNKQP